MLQALTLTMTLRESLAIPLTELEVGEAGTIDHISLPPAGQQFLMRVGFVPGVQVRFSRRAPLGDPSVYSVDGTEIALRAETASRIMVRRGWLSPLGDLA
jgi:Fe2+ transport system protein FeoA